MRGVVSSNSFRYLNFRDVRVTRASSREEIKYPLYIDLNLVTLEICMRWHCIRGISKKRSRILSDIMGIYIMIDCSELKTEWIVLNRRFQLEKVRSVSEVLQMEHRYVSAASLNTLLSCLVVILLFYAMHIFCLY